MKKCQQHVPIVSNVIYDLKHADHALKHLRLRRAPAIIVRNGPLPIGPAPATLQVKLRISGKLQKWPRYVTSQELYSGESYKTGAATLQVKQSNKSS